MTLGEFRKMTEKLSDDLEFVCAGGEIEIVWHNGDAVAIDDEGSIASQVRQEDAATVLWIHPAFNE